MRDEKTHFHYPATPVTDAAKIAASAPVSKDLSLRMRKTSARANLREPDILACMDLQGSPTLQADWTFYIEAAENEARYDPNDARDLHSSRSAIRCAGNQLRWRQTKSSPIPARP
jgi:hypothetical protein